MTQVKTKFDANISTSKIIRSFHLFKRKVIWIQCFRWPNLTTWGKYPCAWVMIERYFVFTCCSVLVAFAVAVCFRSLMRVNLHLIPSISFSFNVYLFLINFQDLSLSHQKSSSTKLNIGSFSKVGWVLCQHCPPSGNYVTELLIMAGVLVRFTRSVTAWDPRWRLLEWESIYLEDTLTETGVSTI